MISSLGKEQFAHLNVFYSLEGRFMETMYNAFWDHLKEQLLSTPPDFTCALELLKEVKEVSNNPLICGC